MRIFFMQTPVFECYINLKQAGKIRKEIITKKDISYRLYIYHMESIRRIGLNTK